MSSDRVVVIDDEKTLVKSLVYGLNEQGFEAHGAFDGAGGLEMVQAVKPDIVLLDLKLPDLSGMEVLVRMKVDMLEMPVVMISAHGDTRTAVEATKRGAEDFIAKPFEFDEVLHLISKTVARNRRRRREGHIEREAGTKSIVGESRSIQDLRKKLDRIAKSQTRTILLLGQSGTGKALAARSIHELSARKVGPFVEVNCATLPEPLIDAEIFGAEKGAYTGAGERRPGLARLADGGTLFLDEIGELPLNLQAKLLNFIETKRFRPIGGGREYQANVRIIAATNRDIEAEVQQGNFRADLYYRLNIVPLVMPSLPERGEDVVLLAHYFSGNCAAEEHCPEITFDDTVLERFRTYHWPGNVRELKNLIERFTILYPGQRIDPGHLPPELEETDNDADTSIQARLDLTEREILLRALAEAKGRKTKAAEALGISRHALKRRLQRLAIG